MKLSDKKYLSTLIIEIMEKSKSFEDLIVWQKAHQFVLNVYIYTKNFPKSELYGLTSQFRRAAISIASNIAEGFGKRGKSDKIRFYNIAQGSINECLYYLILSADLNFGENVEIRSILKEISKLLRSYIESIKSSPIS